MKKNNDVVKDWTSNLPKEFRKSRGVDPTLPTHLIKPTSMMLTVGPTGVGKTNSVIEFLSRKNSQFFEIIIFTGSSKDEPLYNFLASRIDGIKLIDDANELPKVEDYKDSEDKDLEKLIIFDDSVMEDKKTLKQIQKFFMCARKLGFTCIFLAQDYTSTPIFIRRNIHYIQIFKLTDMRDVKNILSKHAMDVDVNCLKNMLLSCTKNKGQFLTIAVNEPPNSKYRQNFIDILDPDDYKGSFDI